jgi:hypothetical protein
MYVGLHRKYSLLSDFNETLSPQILEKYSNTKFHENPFSGSPVIPCGQTDERTDMTKLVVAFRDFVNVPKKWWLKNLYLTFSLMLIRKCKHVYEDLYENTP